MTYRSTTEYWDSKYDKGEIGWDIGYVSTPLKEYFDQLQDKSIKILVPGAGNGWEVEYLHKSGFTNVFLLDFSTEGIDLFRKRYPAFPENRIINADFFKHNEKYKLIVEQTFFSSFNPDNREKYADKMAQLLKPNGKLVGILFNHHFNFDGPPFGGTKEEYKKLFQTKFSFLHFDICYNSIKPRANRELFLLLRKK